MTQEPWFTDSTREIFAESQNPHLQQLSGKEDVVQLEYSQDKVWLGWKKGDKTLFQHLFQQYRERYDLDEETLVFKLAMRDFKEQATKVQDYMFLDRSSPDAWFIGGAPEAGKTWTLQAETDQSHRAGVKNLIIDPHHEYVAKNMYNGIQERFKKLRPDEKRGNIESAVLIPDFVVKGRKRAGLSDRGFDAVDSEGNRLVHKFKFEFQDLDENDLDFIFRNKFGDDKDIEAVVSELERRMNRNSPVTNWNDVFQVVEDLADDGTIWHGRKKQFKGYINSTYKKWGFLGSDKKINLADLFDRYNTVVLSLHDGDMIPENLYMKEMYTGFAIKRVRNLKLTGKINAPVEITFDEAHKFVPSHTQPKFPPSKQQARKTIKEDRKHGIRINLGTQSPQDIPKANFLRLCRHIVIPKQMDPESRQYLLNVGGVFEGTKDLARNKWKDIFDLMNPFDKLYINTKTRYWSIFTPGSPISYKMPGD